MLASGQSGLPRLPSVSGGCYAPQTMPNAASSLKKPKGSPKPEPKGNAKPAAKGAKAKASKQGELALVEAANDPPELPEVETAASPKPVKLARKATAE